MAKHKVIFPKDYCCQLRCKKDCLYARNEATLFKPSFLPDIKPCPYYIPVTEKQYEEISNYNEIDWTLFKCNVVK